MLVTATEEAGILVDHLGPAGGTRIGGRAIDTARVSSGALVRTGKAALRLAIQRRGLFAGRIPRTNLRAYRVLEEIGRGAFSRVYTAIERATGRTVAIKRLEPADGEDREARISAFLREVETAGALDHPGIARVHAAGRKGGDVFLVMDYVDGPDLASWVEIDGPLPETEARRVADGILEALDHAHRHRILHRDVKPANVMLAPGQGVGRIVLVDFGLAVPASRRATWGLTRTGDFRGTPGYLAPECVFDARRHDVRADVYGVGATLHYCLTGRTPADGSPGPRGARPGGAPLGTLRPDLGRDLVGVVARALEADPRRRWPSARSMRDALRASG